MKSSGFSEEQTVKAIEEAELGRKVPEICRDLGVAEATFYAWREMYGGIDVSQAGRLKELEDENRRLKSMI
jgi:putative transposase